MVCCSPSTWPWSTARPARLRRSAPVSSATRAAGWSGPRRSLTTNRLSRADRAARLVLGPRDLPVRPGLAGADVVLGSLDDNDIAAVGVVEQPFRVVPRHVDAT